MRSRPSCPHWRARIGVAEAARVASEDTPYPLSAIYDEEIEQKAADVYSRDYLMFGFGKWG